MLKVMLGFTIDDIMFLHQFMEVPQLLTTVMRSLIQQVQSVGGQPFIGDAPAFGNVTTIAHKSGPMAVAEELGVLITVWTGAAQISYPASYSLGTYKLAREVTKVDVVIDVPETESTPADATDGGDGK